MTIAVTCICHNNFAADFDGPERTVSCPVCAAEMRITPMEDRPIPLPVDAENHLVDVRVLPDGDLALRIEPRDEIVEVDVETVDEDEDDGRDSYAFLPERRELFEAAPSTTFAGPGFWGTMGLLRFRAPISCLAYGRGNRWALVGQGCDVQICNMTAGAKAHGFVEHRALVTSVALSPDGLTAFSADESGELLWWDLATRRVIHRRQAHAGTVLALAVAPNGEYAATGGADGIVRLWDLAASCRECRLADAHWQEQVTALDFSPDGRFLATGGSDGRVDLWRVEAGMCLHRWRGTDTITSLRCAGGFVTAVAAPDENRFVAHPKIWRWQINAQMRLPSAEEWSAPTHIPHCAAFDHEGNRLLVAGLLHALAIQVPAVASVVNEIGDAFRDFFSFVPMNLAQPLLSRPPFSLEVWSLTTGRRLHTFPSLPGKVDHLAVSPENTRILAGMSNGDVQVFAMPGA